MKKKEHKTIKSTCNPKAHRINANTASILLRVYVRQHIVRFFLLYYLFDSYNSLM